MLIQLEFDTTQPIYEQLKDQIIIGIAKGDLQPGERLPSVRNLASDLGINLHTVNKAYQQLKQDGFLQIHRQRGVMVHPEGPPKLNEKEIARFKQTLMPLVATAYCKDLSPQEIKRIVRDILEKDLGVPNHE